MKRIGYPNNMPYHLPGGMQYRRQTFDRVLWDSLHEGGRIILASREALVGVPSDLEDCRVVHTEWPKGSGQFRVHLIKTNPHLLRRERAEEVSRAAAEVPRSTAARPSEAPVALRLVKRRA